MVRKAYREASARSSACSSVSRKLPSVDEDFNQSGDFGLPYPLISANFGTNFAISRSILWEIWISVESWICWKNAHAKAIKLSSCVVWWLWYDMMTVMWFNCHLMCVWSWSDFMTVRGSSHVLTMWFSETIPQKSREPKFSASFSRLPIVPFSEAIDQTECEWNQPVKESGTDEESECFSIEQIFSPIEQSLKVLSENLIVYRDKLQIFHRTTQILIIAIKHCPGFLQVCQVKMIRLDRFFLVLKTIKANCEIETM